MADPHGRISAGPGSPGGLALIGDAAHAMTPFAAQGAAMAIEDAVTLAGRCCCQRPTLAAALAAWEQARRRAVKGRCGAARSTVRLARAGPVAMARNLFLRTRSPGRLAADLDWLYGWPTGLRRKRIAHVRDMAMIRVRHKATIN